jgi:hypothetical protein
MATTADFADSPSNVAPAKAKVAAMDAIEDIVFGSVGLSNLVLLHH